MDNLFKMLIVDDKEVDRNGICYLIRQYGLEVEPITAASGQEALDIISSQTIHILFTDIKMPGMSGHELIREAKNINPLLRVIIFSSYENFDYAHKAIDLGVNKYLLKPIIVDKFLSCMKNILEQLRDEQENRAGELFYDILTGRVNPENVPAGETLQGAALLLDFVEPYFKKNHLELAEDSDDLLTIPLNEFQCAYIARDESKALACADRVMKVLEETPHRFILVYGGRFKDAASLEKLGAQMESCSSSKFYITENTFVNMEKQTEDTSDKASGQCL